MQPPFDENERLRWLQERSISLTRSNLTRSAFLVLASLALIAILAIGNPVAWNIWTYLCLGVLLYTFIGSLRVFMKSVAMYKQIKMLLEAQANGPKNLSP